MKKNAKNWLMMAGFAIAAYVGSASRFQRLASMIYHQAAGTMATLL